jgi:hypothetical protein
MTLDERIESLVAATGATGIEQELSHEGIIAMAPVLTSSVGSSAPPLVVLDTGRSAFFKRFCDQDKNICAQYRQEPFDVPLNEVAAWRLAYALGNPWRQLIPTAVMRKINNLGGALINDKHGRIDTAVFNDAGRQVMAAGFWDALVGNQDRNSRNYRYDSRSTRLGLIDHGFAFARPGDPINHSSFFFAARRQRHGAALSAAEQEVLEAFLATDDLHGLRNYLPADRAQALQRRAEEMLRTRCLPTVGAF